MVQSFASLNRISSEGLSTDFPEPESILEVPLNAFVPSNQDINEMKEDVKVHVKVKAFFLMG